MAHYYSKKIILLMSLLALFLLSVLAQGCSGEGAPAAPQKKYSAATVAGLEKIVESGIEQFGNPGALLCVWDEGYETLIISKGKADIASGRASKIADGFRIGSNTKVFTAMAVLMLADQKKISLDEKLSKYMPDMPHASEVTVRQIGNHTAGYFNCTDDEAFGAAANADLTKRWKPEEIISYIKNRPLDFTPGSKYNYSNTGYIILGMLVERISAMTWENFLSEKIFKPLGLNDTYSPENSSLKGECMKGYVTLGTNPVEIAIDPSFAWAAGSIVSTVPDMKKWLEAVRTGALLSPAMAAEQRKWVDMGPDPFFKKYGFGLMQGGAQFLGHGGSIAGFNSFAFISADGRKCVILVHNLAAGVKEIGPKVIEYLGLNDH